MNNTINHCPNCTYFKKGKCPEFYAFNLKTNCPKFTTKDKIRFN